MENTQSDQVINNELSRQAVSELDLLATLNISRSTLDTLRRDKKFPVVRLSLQNRVYLVESVTDYLKRLEDK